VNRPGPVWRALALLLCTLPASASAADPPITAAAFSPDGKSVVVGSQAGLEVRSWPGLKPVRKLDSKLPHLHDCVFSPKGDLLAVVGGRPAEQGTVELFRWPGAELVSSDVLHQDLIHAFAWRGDGQQWVTASADRTCRLHDAASGKLLHAFDGHSGAVLAIAFTPDGKAVASAGIDQTIRLWDAGTGKQLRSFENHVGPVHALAFRPGQDPETPPLLASASADRTVRLWQPTIGRLVRFARLSSAPLSLAWASDGSRLLAGCTDGHLRIVDPDTVQILEDLQVFKGWAYTLAVPAGGTVLLGGPESQLRGLALKK
jgi:WD40 repeat protein